ncbi:MAG TPA: glycogen debranching enzyme N-terminal domain-containing protein, partial [Candidatus Eisenbacteria bacterium]|nr:glycogen debranching enzyme N-terminal domain-containing protein [Candidatus Eisenbacteria bacterium]
MSDGQDVLDDRRAHGRAWLLADGRGAFAAGTASGAATRRTHALLVVPGGAGPRVALLRF